MIEFPPGATSMSHTVQIVDDAGLGVTGLLAATFPAVFYQIAGANAAVAFPALSDLATITTAWVAGGVKELSGGYYRLDGPDAMLAAVGKVKVFAEETGKHLILEVIDVVTIPSAAANASAVRTELATELARIDVGINTRMATYAQPTGFLATAFPAGTVASSTEVTAIQNNTRTVIVVPEVIERPDSGTDTYLIHLYLYDEVGNMEAPDSAPTVALANSAGTDRSARLGSTTGTLIGTGHYSWVYTNTSTDTLEQLLWEFSVVEGGATRLFGRQSLLVDATAVDFTSADRVKLTAISDKLPVNNIADETIVLAAIAALPTAAENATAFWTDATAGDFAVPGTPGKILVVQLGGGFTTNLSSVFSTAALANGPSGSGGGTGAFPCTVKVTTNGTTPIVGATVRISGAQSGLLTTDAGGLAAFSLDAGAVTLSISAPGYSYAASSETIGVTGLWATGGLSTRTVAMTANPAVTPSVDPDLTNVFFTCRDASGEPIEGASFRFVLVDQDVATDAWGTTIKPTATSDAAGLVEVLLPVSMEYQLLGPDGRAVSFTTGTSPTQELHFVGNF